MRCAGRGRWWDGAASEWAGEREIERGRAVDVVVVVVVVVDGMHVMLIAQLRDVMTMI